MRMVRNLRYGRASVFFLAAVLFAVHTGFAQRDQFQEYRNPFQSGKFRWWAGEPVLSPTNRPGDKCYSVKDPSVVKFEDRWHLFCTIRSEKRTHQIEYVSFKNWEDANSSPRHVLTVSTGYFCAPQVFYFTPHRKWYLIYQVNEPSRKPSLQPAFSTSTNIADPKSWTAPKLLFTQHPTNIKAWIDFWVICDDAKAHLFFTSNNGLMWRSETKLADFPLGWNEPLVVLRDDIFEASHTYKLQGTNKFLTLVEAEAGPRRYYKAYLADTLDGEWKPLAATQRLPFASALNVRHRGPYWTESFSHGELLRAGYDEHLEVNPNPKELRFLFQGVTDKRKAGKPYGEIPWELGILEPAIE